MVVRTYECVDGTHGSRWQSVVGTGVWQQAVGCKMQVVASHHRRPDPDPHSPTRLDSPAHKLQPSSPSGEHVVVRTPTDLTVTDPTVTDPTVQVPYACSDAFQLPSCASRVSLYEETNWKLHSRHTKTNASCLRLVTCATNIQVSLTLHSYITRPLHQCICASVH